MLTPVAGGAYSEYHFMGEILALDGLFSRPAQGYSMSTKVTETGGSFMEAVSFFGRLF
jgi:hypothetical protein